MCPIANSAARAWVKGQRLDEEVAAQGQLTVKVAQPEPQGQLAVKVEQPGPQGQLAGWLAEAQRLARRAAGQAA